ncbi:MAG: Eco57I restriction-modification methylase domain-containing protein [Mariniphaga sp.]|nr:Eco57I restriction-modification methylase domain-containing protein [Mariniphaga sp.]
MNKKEIIHELENLQINILNILVKNKELLKYFNPPSTEITEEDLNFMLLNNGNYNLTLQTHKLIISEIIYQVFFEKNKIKKNELSKTLFIFKEDSINKIHLQISLKKIIGKLKKSEVCEIIEQFHIHYLNSKHIIKDGNIFCEKSFVNYKDKGSVYTPVKIAKEITHKTIKNRIKNNINPGEIKIFDFGCATGMFFISAFEFLNKKLKLDKRSIIKDNLWGGDIDGIALDILKIKIYNQLDKPEIKDLELISSKLFDDNLLTSDKKMNELNNFFDVVVSNPPYFLLKINKKDSKDKNMQEYNSSLKKRINDEVKFFRKSSYYRYSTEGMLNYYKLSLEVIVNFCKSNGEIGIICPSTLFADLSSKKLRKHLILDNRLRSIKYFPESTKIFDNVCQSTVIFYMQKGFVTKDVKIFVNGESLRISRELIERAFGENYEMPYIDKTGWDILNKISNYKKLKNFENIRNKRGELDLTLFKNFITKDNTGWRLVRGKMIGNENIIEKNQEFVKIDEFIKKKSKDFIYNDFNKERLVCQQISNVDTKKRLNFVKCVSKDILANSCNYINVLNNNDLDKIRLTLNSYLLNWRFKITSSNNHINNYELDELPIVNSNLIDNLSKNSSLKDNINICKLYGLNKEETFYILKPYFEVKKIENGLKNENI